MLGTRTTLGLAIDESGVFVAEVDARAGRSQLRRAGHLAFDETLDLDNAAELGQQLRQFLRENHFSSRRAVVGMPTKWIVAKEIVTPPAGADALAGMLSIQAERAFSLNASELIFDYCGQSSATESSTVMLLAARQQIIEQIKTLADAAGLQVQAVTVSALAFGHLLSKKDSGQRYGLYARPGYFEFWSQSAGRPRSIKHVPMTSANGALDDPAARVASAIERQILLASQQDRTPPYRVSVYDGGTLSNGVIDRIKKQLGPQIDVTDGRDELKVGGLDATGDPAWTQSIAAAAVALTGAGARKPSVDFLNPRIGRHEASPHKRLIGWAAVAGFVCVVLVGSAIASWYSTRSDIATYREQLEVMGPDIEVARGVVERCTYARSWTSQDPVFLECWRQLTEAFPEEGTIWVTSLGLTDEADGSVMGRAVNEASVLDVIDRIKDNKAFSDVQTVHIRGVGGNSSEKEFVAKFKFQGAR